MKNAEAVLSEKFNSTLSSQKLMNVCERRSGCFQKRSGPSSEILYR
jgi:hypothetical protein